MVLRISRRTLIPTVIIATDIRMRGDDHQGAVASFGWDLWLQDQSPPPMRLFLFCHSLLKHCLWTCTACREKEDPPLFAIQGLDSLGPAWPLTLVPLLPARSALWLFPTIAHAAGHCWYLHSFFSLLISMFSICVNKKIKQIDFK